ncbi:uncharacterized protein LOC142356686, partial [Convolutriloba macropyga]|uniref:uncharacterized protein LOC142356686 n=1 Tax=Convolutriloba macropyga TaxID=536237 RepID=UPI003F5267CD
ILNASFPVGLQIIENCTYDFDNTTHVITLNSLMTIKKFLSDPQFDFQVHYLLRRKFHLIDITMTNFTAGENVTKLLNRKSPNSLISSHIVDPQLFAMLRTQVLTSNTPNDPTDNITRKSPNSLISSHIVDPQLFAMLRTQVLTSNTPNDPTDNITLFDVKGISAVITACKLTVSLCYAEVYPLDSKDFITNQTDSIAYKISKHPKIQKIAEWLNRTDHTVRDVECKMWCSQDEDHSQVSYEPPEFHLEGQCRLCITCPKHYRKLSIAEWLNRTDHTVRDVECKMWCSQDEDHSQVSYEPPEFHLEGQCRLCITCPKHYRKLSLTVSEVNSVPGPPTTLNLTSDCQ